MIRDDKSRKIIRKNMSNNCVFAGIDLGDSSSLTTVLSPAGDIADRFSFQMDEQGYALFSDKVPRDARLAFEATSSAYPFSRILKGLGYHDTTVAHPTELAWIVRSKKKNDRADSLKIAKLHFAGLLPESHLLSQEEQIERDLLIQRVKLGRDR
jgi:transposase